MQTTSDTPVNPDPQNVFEILGLEPGNAPPAPVARIDPPRREDTPPLPAPGIYFDMEMVDYLAIPALSNSGVKQLAASPMIFWANSWMNPKRERKEKEHFVAGEAYHCRICEGSEVFHSRFAASYTPDPEITVLRTVDDIKDAISKVVSVVNGSEIRHEPMSKVEVDDGLGGTKKVAAKREDWARQLLEINPDAPLAEKLEADYRAQHEGKQFIHPELLYRIELGAAMIERDAGIAPYFRGGIPEVVLIWFCPATGVPMKARVDYLKVKRMIDLKTFENQRQRSPEVAIRWEIASYKYNIQPSVYLEGGQEVRKIIREQGDAAIHICSEPDAARFEQCREFAHKWASHIEPDIWDWCFQQKGDAPITRVVEYPMGTVKMVTDEIVREAKKRFAKYAPAFGHDPWLDIAAPYMIADEDVPLAAVEM